LIINRYRGIIKAGLVIVNTRLDGYSNMDDLLFIDFLNSDWHDYRVKGVRQDRLTIPDWVSGFLQRHKLQGPAPLDESTLAALVALRTLLHRMVSTLYQGHNLNSADFASLNEFLKLGPVRRELEKDGESYRVLFKPLRQDWAWVMAEIVASFTDVLTHQDTGRLRICENEDCGWIFYDASKNRTQRWCQHNTCANLMKVRRFRARQREKASGQK